MSMTHTIGTALPGCLLRPWRAEDKAELIRHANNRRVWRNLKDVFPHPYTEAAAEFWIEFANRATPRLHLAIELDGAAVGGIGMSPGSGLTAHTAQFGYWLGESCWGRGIATAAARAMVGYARAQFSFVRLEAQVFEWNPASMRVLEKVGFGREAILRRSVLKDGQIIDSMLYALLLWRDENAMPMAASGPV